MALSYERNDGRRLVTVIGRGDIQTDEILDVIDQMRRERTWSYGLLYDIRVATGHPMLRDLRRIAQTTAQPGPDGELRGPVAVVVTNLAIYAMTCAYAALASRGRVEVFRDRDEAEHWLAARMQP